MARRKAVRNSAPPHKSRKEHTALFLILGGFVIQSNVQSNDTEMFYILLLLRYTDAKHCRANGPNDKRPKWLKLKAALISLVTFHLTSINTAVIF